MSGRAIVVVGVLWLASLAAVAAARDRAGQSAPDARAQALPVPDPRIVTGGDIGFRIEGWQGRTPTGTLVIRVNGQWVEPAASKRPVLITP
jgi:hypothetical protein